MMIRFTYCQNFASAETKEVEWDPFATVLMTFKSFPSKEASIRRAAFVGGVRADETKGRADDNIAVRTVATLDFDAPQGSLADIEFQLGMAMPCAFVAYSTFRHTPEVPRFRLCVPLSRPVSEAEYKVIVSDIERLVDLGPVDKCSFVMSQIMFLPSNREGVTPWSLRQDGEPWAVNLTEIAAPVRNADDADFEDLGDLQVLVASEPLDMGLAEIDALLENYPAEGKDYDEWVRVGMALYHQFRGSADGYGRWLAWSEKSSKHDARHMRTKWRSFGGDRNPVTMASIIHLAGGRRAAVEIAPTGNTFASLEAEARGLRSLEDYTRLRNKVGALGEAQLRGDMRMMLAGIAFDVFGKGANMTRAVINKAFKPAKGKEKGKDESEGFFGDSKTPEWATDIVYCSGENTLERVSTRHSVKPDAFRIAHAGEPEVIGAEIDAVTFLMRNNLIPHVDAKMYWPGFGSIFTDSSTGLTYLNTYERDGAEPCDELDEEGRTVVDRFLAHLNLTVGAERERRIVLDFMAFVYQNPGKRVQWALLLKGIEGNGKSYFFRVMQALLGKQASVVSTTAIDSAFTGWAEGSILACIEEIRISGVNKYAILDKMKPIISNDTIPVVHKGKNEKHIPNFTSYMMMTNHADAIPVGDNDRRYCVIFTRQTRKEDLFAELGGKEGASTYFEGLFGDLARRPDALARFFTDYKISADFSAAGRAPETEGLSDMRNMHISEDRENVENALADYACDIVSQNLIDVTYLNRMATADGKDMPMTSKLAHILSDMGYVQIEGRKVKINKAEDKHTVWFRRGSVVPSGQEMTSELAKNMTKDFFNNDKDFTDAPF
jgi:hypothetical protein